MWNSRTRNDLIIEVWEKLDCESVGAAEIEAIETVVADQYGRSAVDSPMVIARLLADEGAELRHAEIMQLYVARASGGSGSSYDAAFRNVLKIDDLKGAARSIRNLENLRRKYAGDNDKDGLRLVRETALRGKQAAADTASSKGVNGATREMSDEIVEWFRIWLGTPEIFDTWLELRQSSADFVSKFGDIRESK
jgi:hypothetical protein